MFWIAICMNEWMNEWNGCMNEWMGCMNAVPWRRWLGAGRLSPPESTNEWMGCMNAVLWRRWLGAGRLSPPESTNEWMGCINAVPWRRWLGAGRLSPPESTCSQPRTGRWIWLKHRVHFSNTHHSNKDCDYYLKGQCREIFASGFFHESSSLKPRKIT
jgi:hypothetical protein